MTRIFNLDDDSASKFKIPTSSSTSLPPEMLLWSLPQEILISIIKRLHISDLLSLRSCNSYFRDLIDTHHAAIWSSVSFRNSWPNQRNLVQFAKAAKQNNIEALIKLGIAYLYNEGFTGDFSGKSLMTYGKHSASMFYKVERLRGDPKRRCDAPFSWLFFRPPWSSGSCCKQCVFRNIKEHTSQKVVPFVEIGIFKTLQYLKNGDSDTEQQDERALFHLEKAIAQGSTLAEFLKWQITHAPHLFSTDRSLALKSIRWLRDLAQDSSCLPAQTELCRAYLRGARGLLSKSEALHWVRNWIQSSLPLNITNTYTDGELTHNMRFILLDWLVEVGHMKGFGSVVLHTAFSVVDRYLACARVSRTRLQLVGVASLVLCSRFLWDEIITIREAAWLTDNTYKYEEVLRMLGEITATLCGNFKVLMPLDYVQVIGQAAGNDQQAQCMSEYFCELVMLHSELLGSDVTQAEIAAACVLIARLTLKKEFPWSEHLVEATGFSVQSLSQCVVAIHEKCFDTKTMVDHRNVKLEAVRVRYSEESLCQVSDIEILSTESLRQLLGFSLPDSDPPASSPAAASHDDSYMNLIASPSRSRTGCGMLPHAARLPEVHRQQEEDREQAGTPTLHPMPCFPTDASPEEDGVEELNISTISGYEADQEEEESTLRIASHEDSHLNGVLEKHWGSESADPCSDLSNQSVPVSCSPPFNSTSSCDSSPSEVSEVSSLLPRTSSGFNSSHQSTDSGISSTSPLPQSSSFAVSPFPSSSRISSLSFPSVSTPRFANFRFSPVLPSTSSSPSLSNRAPDDPPTLQDISNLSLSNQNTTNKRKNTENDGNQLKTRVLSLRQR